MMLKAWTLKACAIRSAQEWSWCLFDATGALAAEHEVRLDAAAWEWRGFVNLASFLRQASEHTREQEARLFEEVGDFLGARVLGSIAEVLARAAPVVVRLEAEERSAQDELRRGIFYRPFEIARYRGRSLCLRGVSFVVDVGATLGAKRRPDRPLRVLAVFSLPQGASALNLRRERYLLRRRLQMLADQGHALELKLLQFGATRKALTEILNEQEGWDVIHFSGHGLAAHLVLEKEDGSIDKVSGAEFADLLQPNCDRLQWLTLSSCSSAAATLAETKKWLSLEVRDLDPADEEEPGTLPALAHELAEKLDCAVLAMRFPISDRFAIDLAEAIYPQVLGSRQGLPQALAVTLAALLGGESKDRYPVLSQAIPAIFGRRALALDLTLRQFSTAIPHRTRGFAHLPDPPERFVGRVRELTLASRALAPGNQARGVLFYGMCGAGKSSCARELARLYEDLGRFSHVVYYEAPRFGSEAKGTLAAFALAWERVLETLPMTHAIGSDADMELFLSRLRDFLESSSVLIVLDNLESLLHDPGSEGFAEWREPQWSKLYQTLHHHCGPSRVVSTSLFQPRLAGAPCVEKIALHALHLDEALLLARELPNLGRIFEERSEIFGDLDAGPELIRRLLEVIQGHPKLLELADRQAADPLRFREMLAAAEGEGAEGRSRLQVFFNTCELDLGEIALQFRLMLWVALITENLSESTALLFHVLCCLQEADRRSSILAAKWPEIFHQIESPTDEPPDLASAFERLQAVGLVEMHRNESGDEVWRMHAGVAGAGREHSNARSVQEVVDFELAFYWSDVHFEGIDLERKGRPGGHQALEGAENALPYLMRREMWDVAAGFLEAFVLRHDSPPNLAKILPRLRRVIEATSGRSHHWMYLGILARALWSAGQVGEAESLYRQVAQEREESGDIKNALLGWGQLFNLLLQQGRLPEAGCAVEKQKDLARQAILGSGPRFGIEVHRLWQLLSLGRAQEVLDGVESLRPEIETHCREEAALDESDENSWNTLEALLDAGREAASQLGEWKKAVALNGAVLASRKRRGASSLELATTRYNAYGPLIQLGRLAEVRELLESCRAVFEAERSIEMLGMALKALATLESEEGHHQAAVDRQQVALRYGYLTGDPERSAGDHYNLANHLVRLKGEPAFDALAHRFAALLLHAGTGSGQFHGRLEALVLHLKWCSALDLRLDFGAICDEVEKVRGVHFREIFERLPKSFAASGEEAFAKVVAMAREAAVRAP